ncbi:hypothetical protein MuYL_4119 [Mucilaginibacter xinganensis]|uniref:Uncharacterized protein n=1 Tax=Mucilaginibacter xinganensis TaxID=1234841 RepID=A0A223P234_9SPHI|nr:hypothetical protein MuYL_4119 [Mucilaginibacter xinganensis]
MGYPGFAGSNNKPEFNLLMIKSSGTKRTVVPADPIWLHNGSRCLNYTRSPV